MRNALIALGLFLSVPTPADAQVSISINLGGYPTLQRVPGYPVYYAPGVNSNYFFYDGLYWVYEGDRWYASSWYNGPWRVIDPFDVPAYVLRVPVRYYRHAPAYFRGWRADAPPRWGDHWGHSWESRRSGWDRWNRSSAPAPAPLPTYQRQYSGNRYPHAQEQAVIQTRSYRYEPRDSVARTHYQEQRAQVPAAPQRQAPATQRAQQQPQQQQQTPQQQPPQQQQQRRQQEQQQKRQQEQQQQQQRQQAQPQPQQQQRQQAQPQPQQQPARGQPPRAEQKQEQPAAKNEGKGRGRDNNDRDDKEKGSKGRER